MTLSWLFLAFSHPASSWVALSPPSPLALLFLHSPPPPLVIRAAQKPAPGSKEGGKSRASGPRIAYPWLRKCLGERALCLPGRGQCVWSKLALSQNSALVSAFSQLRNWAKFGQRPIQSPVLEYVSVPPLHLLSPRETRRPDKLFPHQALIRVAWHHFSSPGKELELNFPLSRSNIDLELGNNISFDNKFCHGSVFNRTGVKLQVLLSYFKEHMA